MGTMRAATWVVSASVGLLGAAACGDDGGSSTESSASAGGGDQAGVGSTSASSGDGGNASGSGGGATSGPNAASATSGPSSVVATTGAGGSMAFVCDPPAAPGSLFENEAPALDVTMLEPVSMCQFRGDVLLIVNTAAI
jgi:hypothetical protein